MPGAAGPARRAHVSEPALVALSADAVLLPVSPLAPPLAVAGHERGGEVQMLGTRLSGIVFGVSFIVAGTIWVPVVAHIIHNWLWLILLRRKFRAETSVLNGQP